MYRQFFICTDILNPIYLVAIKVIFEKQGWILGDLQLCSTIISYIS